MAQDNAVATLFYDGEADHDTLSLHQLKVAVNSHTVSPKSWLGAVIKVELTRIQELRSLSLSGRMERHWASFVTLQMEQEQGSSRIVARDCENSGVNAVYCHRPMAVVATPLNWR